MRDRILQMVPGIEEDEYIYVSRLTEGLTPSQLQTFCVLYNTKRKSSEMILISTVIGFFGVAGIQRFITGQILLGLLYFFTGGLCLIGTLVDLINYRSLAFEANRQAADETRRMVASM
ncbi:membrane protein [Fulvitalea axinellae]|uniref:Membrane protein n=1 Tax=Fulvitalea axinellae TaxID=1182444 RepID=A0AAU9CKT9_9BACT|nr:membrane protein [Fulvitalea axinellae]